MISVDILLALYKKTPTLFVLGSSVFDLKSISIPDIPEFKILVWYSETDFFFPLSDFSGPFFPLVNGWGKGTVILKGFWVAGGLIFIGIDNNSSTAILAPRCPQ